MSDKSRLPRARCLTASSSSTSRPGGRATTSSARLRRAYGQRRVGHAGTLDPDATGVLLVGLGRATRLLRFLQETTKAYRGRIVFGIATTTLDASGAVLDQRPMMLTARKSNGPARNSSARSSSCRRWCRRCRSAAAVSTSSPARARRSSARRGTCASTGSTSRSSSRARIPRPRCSSSAGAAPTCGSLPPTSVPHSAGARTWRCGGCESGRSRSTRRTRSTMSARNRRRWCCRRQSRCATSSRVDVDDEQARAVAHGMAFHASALGAGDGELGLGPFAMIDAGGTLLAVYERRGAAVKPRGGAGMRIVHELYGARDAESAGGSVVTIGVYDGVHLGHHAVLRLVRDLADARHGRGVRHLRPAPRRGRAPPVGAAAPHRHRAEARAPRRVGLPRHVLRAPLRRGSQPGVGGGLRARGARRRRPGAPRRRRCRLPLRTRPRRERAHARADGRGARVRGARRRPRSRG